jgi:Zn-dependent M32 family carboxypeptidase
MKYLIFFFPLLLILSACYGLTDKEAEIVRQLRVKSQEALVNEAKIIMALIQKAEDGTLTIKEATDAILKVKADTYKLVQEINEKIAAIYKAAEARGETWWQILLGFLTGAIGVRSKGGVAIFRSLVQKILRLFRKDKVPA